MRYYLIDNDPDDRYEDEDDLVEYCVSQEYFDDDDDSFREYINECNRSIEICGYDFEPADVLETMNEDWYRRARWEWAGDQAYNEKENAIYEAKHTAVGESFYICGYEVFVYDDDDDEDDYIPENDVSEIIAAAQTMVEAEKQKEEEEQKREISFESLFQVI